jgi:hypothetical protein
MKKLMLAAAGLMTGATMMLCSSPAMAHGVDWSVSIGVPLYAPPPVVYSPPPVVYEQPAPVYVAPAPVVRYAPQPYVVYRDPYWRRHEWREHEWREHERREHEWREHHHD